MGHVCGLRWASSQGVLLNHLSCVQRKKITILLHWPNHKSDRLESQLGSMQTTPGLVGCTTFSQSKQHPNFFLPDVLKKQTQTLSVVCKITMAPSKIESKR